MNKSNAKADQKGTGLDTAAVISGMPGGTAWFLGLLIAGFLAGCDISPVPTPITGSDEEGTAYEGAYGSGGSVLDPDEDFGMGFEEPAAPTGRVSEGEEGGEGATPDNGSQDMEGNGQNRAGGESEEPETGGEGGEGAEGGAGGGGLEPGPDGVSEEEDAGIEEEDGVHSGDVCGPGTEDIDSPDSDDEFENDASGEWGGEGSEEGEADTDDPDTSGGGC